MSHHTPIRGILKGPSCSPPVLLRWSLRCNPDRSATTEGEQQSRSPDLLDAHEGAVRDVTRFLLFTRDAHDDHGAVAGRFRADADVGRSPVLVTDREHDLGISRLERAASAHVPGCAVRNRGARFGPAGLRLCGGPRLIWRVRGTAGAGGPPRGL